MSVEACGDFCMEHRSRIAVLETEIRIANESRKTVMESLARIEEQTRKMSERVTKSEDDIRQIKEELTPIKEAIQSFTKISDTMGRLWWIISGAIIFVAPLAQTALHEIIAKFFR